MNKDPPFVITGISPLKVELHTPNGIVKREIKFKVLTDNSSDQAGDSQPPDGGYGWICVLACFAINCFTWGPVSVSLFSVVQQLD